MKKLLSILGLFVIFLLAYIPVSAHIAGQPPFFKINNVFLGFYPVTSSSLENFALPQDIAPTPYLVNQSLSFEMDTTQLPAPQEIIKRTKFDWDFGDKEKGSGLKNTHAYKKPGSYILSITANDGTTPTAQLLETAFIQILPNKDYKLPQSIILVNGRKSKDPITDVFEMDLTQPIQFDGTNSTGDVATYFWDFGDGTTSTEKSPEHIYNKSLNIIYPLLRVTDKNGFISDSYVEIDTNKLDPKKLVPSKAVVGQSQSRLPLYIGGGLGVLLVLVVVIILSKRKSKKTS